MSFVLLQEWFGYEITKEVRYAITPATKKKKKQKKKQYIYIISNKTKLTLF